MFNKVESDPIEREGKFRRRMVFFFKGGGVGVSNYCTITFKVHSK